MPTVHLTPSLAITGTSGGSELDPDGPLVVLVHGAGMNRTVWSLQTRWLNHHGVNAVAIDLPGHGASSEPALASIGEYADWLVSRIGDLGRDVHLVGHSMGTFIALEYGRRRPLASITLVGTAAAMPVHSALIEAAQQDLPLAARLMSGWAFTNATRTGPHPSPGSSMVGSTVAMVAQSRPGVLHADLTQCADYHEAAQAMGDIAATPTRVTFLLGEIDRMTPVRAAQPLIDAAPNARQIVVRGVGHMVPVEAPERTRTAIASAVAPAEEAVAHG